MGSTKQFHSAGQSTGGRGCPLLLRKIGSLLQRGNGRHGDEAGGRPGGSRALADTEPNDPMYHLAHTRPLAPPSPAAPRSPPPLPHIFFIRPPKPWRSSAAALPRPVPLAVAGPPCPHEPRQSPQLDPVAGDFSRQDSWPPGHERGTHNGRFAESCCFLPETIALTPSIV